MVILRKTWATVNRQTVTKISATVNPWDTKDVIHNLKCQTLLKAKWRFLTKLFLSLKTLQMYTNQSPCAPSFSIIPVFMTYTRVLNMVIYFKCIVILTYFLKYFEIFSGRPTWKAICLFQQEQQLYIVKQVGCKNWSMNSDFLFFKKRNFLTWYYSKYI